ncbi:MAG: DNA-3-methyladenine glycosylase 2 family protein [Comamonadaceae bacterium]|nr:MAG: DNA-3-methyladenine glycosylase 2 family protein [Comamonadaceae bacterium]
MSPPRMIPCMSSVPATPTEPDDDARYLALKTRDARFDGRFFTGVTSTGIYCRPVCSVKTPKRENCRFFSHAAQAEHAGFRPCLRCRPELAPHSVLWSIQDASYILAHQAARLLDEPEAWTGIRGDDTPSACKLATRLGVSDRHVRRIFEAQFGVSPMQYLQTRRLLTAKQLLADTCLPITQIALASGFSSVRRFNSAFADHYGLNPTAMRRQADPPAGRGICVRLGYRPPYDAAAMLAFFSRRAIDSMEAVSIDAGKPWLRRTLRVEAGGRVYKGWLAVEFDAARSQVLLQVGDSLRDVLPLVIRRTRAAFDLDADPQAINALLGTDFPGSEGLRVPGTLDGYELAVRAVLGQQITVAAGRTLAQRLVHTLGEPVATPWNELYRLFPSPQALASADPDLLGSLGIVRQRQAAITGIARAVAGKNVQLHGGADVNATIAALKELPGIGDWTAQYIAMRALRWPDAFPAGDVALHNAMGVRGLKNPAREADARSLAWQPWRSYAVIRCWSGLLRPAEPALPLE